MLPVCPLNSVDYIQCINVQTTVGIIDGFNEIYVTHPLHLAQIIVFVRCILETFPLYKSSNDTLKRARTSKITTMRTKTILQNICEQYTDISLLLIHHREDHF